MIYCTVGKHFKEEDCFRKGKQYQWANSTRGICKECWKERQLENWHRNKFIYRKNHKSWEKNNREYLIEYQTQYRIQMNLRR